MNKVKVKLGAGNYDSRVVLSTPEGDFNIPASKIVITANAGKSPTGVATLFLHEIEGELQPEFLTLEVKKLTGHKLIKVEGMDNE